MYTIYYIFIGIIILSFITGVILNKIEKNASSQSAISSVTSTSTNIDTNVDTSIGKELLNSIEDDGDLSETRVFTIPFSANYIEKEKVDKIKKSKKSKVIDDEILW